MSILIGILIGFLVYSFIVMPVFMELALDKPKKTKEGKLRIRKKGFVIKFFYGVNIGRSEKDKCFPKNTYQLYKGIYIGFLFFFFVSPACIILIAFLLLLLFGDTGDFF